MKRTKGCVCKKESIQIKISYLIKMKDAFGNLQSLHG